MRWILAGGGNCPSSPLFQLSFFSTPLSVLSVCIFGFPLFFNSPCNFGFPFCYLLFVRVLLSFCESLLFLCEFFVFQDTFHPRLSPLWHAVVYWWWFSTTILCSSVPQVPPLLIFLGGVLWSGDAFKVQYVLTTWIMGELCVRVACSPHSQFKALVHLVTGYLSLVVMVDMRWWRRWCTGGELWFIPRSRVFLLCGCELYFL